jgi:hypothetical protein
MDSNAFDPAAIGDPVALRTKWEPMAGSHANFQIYEWQKIDAQRALFAPTGSIKLFCGVFAAMGALMIVSACVPGFSGAQGGNSGVAGLFGILFIAGPALLYLAACAPITFDKSAGSMRRGQKWSPDPAPLDLARVRAVQLLPRIRAYDNSHDTSAAYRETHVRSWELNLVLEDGAREHLVGQISWSGALSEARLLATFLGKPVWNAAEGNLQRRET